MTGQSRRDSAAAAAATRKKERERLPERGLLLPVQPGRKWPITPNHACLLLRTGRALLTGTTAAAAVATVDDDGDGDGSACLEIGAQMG